MPKVSTEQARHEIESAAQDAVKTVARAAEEAARVVSAAAAEALKVATVKNIDGTSDHDVLNTLVANVQFLKESQDKFHLEMKDSFADLKNNYSARLLDIEKRIDTNGKRITALETSKTRQNVLMSIGIGILTLLVSLLIYHLIGQ